MEFVTPQVTLIAKTEFFRVPDNIEWDTDTDGGEALVEFSGRACYSSWKKPNPATATNEGYLRHILEVGHASVLEHASVSFYITGISRSLSHELVRHRHFSYSQLSQRYVSEKDAKMVLPPSIVGDVEAQNIFETVTEASLLAYEQLVAHLVEKFKDEPNKTLRRKLARQAARAVLPNATETKIVVTGNYRAWRHFIMMRASEHADVEIRWLAVEVLRQLQKVAPNVFGDFVVGELPDGTECLAASYSPEV